MQSSVPRATVAQVGLIYKILHIKCAEFKAAGRVEVCGRLSPAPTH